MSSNLIKKVGLLAATAALSTPLFVTTANAASDTGNATATIITAISIANNTDLAFGSIVADATTAGTVAISTTGAETCTTVTCVASTRSAGQFTISGQSGYAYTVTLPTDGTVTITDGTNTMAVNGFTHNASGTLAASTEQFEVGATLSVGIAQVAGAYTGTYTVSVVYN